jgi:hypothetical protein
MAPPMQKPWIIAIVGLGQPPMAAYAPAVAVL